MEIINPENGQKLWACAYKTNNTEKGMALRKTPVFGKIDRGYFFELNKNGEMKRKGVSRHARKYANTKEECVEIYNNLINKQIEFLRELIYEHEKDKIY